MSVSYGVKNIYIDESCHLQGDKDSKFMGIGGIVCPKDKLKEIKGEIEKLKRKHELTPKTELKWTKISEKKKLLYMDLVELFFEKEYLEFRIVLVNKEDLTKETGFGDFYYKICYLLLKYMVRPKTFNNIFLDKKDTNGSAKVAVLHKCLDKIRTNYDSDTIKIGQVQNIQSHEVALMQILDVLLGAMVYKARGLSKMSAKTDIIDMIKMETGLTLDRSTPLSEHKFNILYFKSGVNCEEV